MIDLRMSEIQEAPPAVVQKAICEAAKSANLYPNYSALISKLAAINKVLPENIMLINGADSAIALTVRLAKKVVYFEPSYYEFEAAPKRNKIQYAAIKLSENKGTAIYKTDKINYCADISNLDLSEGTVLFLCNPNNPFGELERGAAYDLIKASKGLVAIDETYNLFGKWSAAEWLIECDNLIIFRSFSKDFGLAGLRIGYIISTPKLIEELRQSNVIFDISGPSVAGALAALGNIDYFRKQVSDVINRRKRIEATLADLCLPLVRSSVNHLILHLENEAEAKRLASYLRERSILVSQGNGVGTCGLDNSWIRFAVGNEEQAQVFLGVLKKYSS